MHEVYDVARSIYLEASAFCVSLGTRLLQVRDGMNYRHDGVLDNAILCPIAIASVSLSSAEQCYSNIECEALGILYGLEMFHHYHFRSEVCINNDHKPLVTLLSKYVATLSQHYSLLCK